MTNVYDIPVLRLFVIQYNNVLDISSPPSPPTLERQTNHNKIEPNEDGYLGDIDDFVTNVKNPKLTLKRSDSQFVTGFKVSSSTLKRSDTQFVTGYLKKKW